MNPPLSIKILKFGGTSMADEQSWSRVLDLIQSAGPSVVVVSATARTTRRLRLAADLACRGALDEAFKIADEIAERHKTIIESFTKQHGSDQAQAEEVKQLCDARIDEEMEQLRGYLNAIPQTGSIRKHKLDQISAVGERISSFLLAQCGPLVGLETQFIDAADIMITDARFGKAEPDLKTISQRARVLSDHIKLDHTPIIGGYYGQTPQGDTTTLGLEGSDYTASILGYALNATRVEIWTDVSGVYSCDPQYIEDAIPVAELTYDQAREMATLGAKVLHPQTLEPARSRNIPVWVKNMFAPSDPGTRIHHQTDESRPITAIAYKEDNMVLKVQTETPTDRSKVLAVLDRYDIVPDLAVCEQYQLSLSMDLDESVQQDFIEEMSAELTTEVNLHYGQIALIGCSEKLNRYLWQYVFKELQDIPVYLVGQGQERQTLILTVPSEHTLKAVARLHSHLCIQNSDMLEYRVEDHSN